MSEGNSYGQITLRGHLEDRDFGNIKAEYLARFAGLVASNRARLIRLIDERKFEDVEIFLQKLESNSNNVDTEA